MMTRLGVLLLRGLLVLASMSAELGAAEILGLSWPSGQASYRVNPNFPELEIAGSSEHQSAIIQCGARTWREQTSADFEFVFEGTTTRSGVDTADGENIVSWTRFEGDGALAATFFRPADEGEFGGFDIVFYSDSFANPIHWSGLGEPPPGTVDIRGIATHEFGHALGLGHVLDEGATMFPAARERGLVLRTLGELDRGCIESLYGLRVGGEPILALTAIEPAFGPTIGGNVVSFHGANFTYESESRLVVGGSEIGPALWVVEHCGTLRVDAMPPRGPGAVEIRLENSIGEVVVESAYEYRGPPLLFLRADANRDGTVDLSDSLTILGNLFLGEPASLLCEKSADTNDSGGVDLSDAVSILDNLFNGGPDPREPYPECGEDPTPDPVFCESSGCE